MTRVFFYKLLYLTEEIVTASHQIHWSASQSKEHHSSNRWDQPSSEHCPVQMHIPDCKQGNQTSCSPRFVDYISPDCKTTEKSKGGKNAESWMLLFPCHFAQCCLILKFAIIPVIAVLHATTPFCSIRAYFSVIQLSKICFCFKDRCKQLFNESVISLSSPFLQADYF